LQFVPIETRGFKVSGATGGTVTIYPSEGQAGAAPTVGASSGQVADPVSNATPERPTGVRDALYYFLAGGRLWLAKDYKGAIAPYEKALELEKKNPTLSRDYWRVLVDSLGMAYGMNGDLDRAEATLRYGVSKDPDYPMFYYNLACASGERGNMNAAMKYLREAFARKQNSIAGESVPDPRTDDSFRKFMSNAEFKEFADGLVEGKNRNREFVGSTNIRRDF
jgi:tetratricopeptide (TPR) repeat protein